MSGVPAQVAQCTHVSTPQKQSFFAFYDKDGGEKFSYWLRECLAKP